MQCDRPYNYKLEFHHQISQNTKIFALYFLSAIRLLCDAAVKIYCFLNENLL